MKQVRIIKPYSDDSLTFNEKTKRYELTIEFCKANYDSTFRDDGVLERRIKKNTRTVYNFIWDRVASYNKNVVDYLLNNTQEGRDFILELLSTQMEADIESGYNDTGNLTPINASNGQIIDRGEIKRNVVSVDTEAVFDRSDSYFGLRINYQGPLPPIYIKR